MFKLIVLLLALIAASLASHGRYGTIKFTKSPSDPNTVTFTFDASFRRTYFGAPNVGTTVTDASFSFGDGTSVVPQLKVTEIDTSLDLIIVQWTGSHRYNAAGGYTVGWSSCCRIAALNNNPEYSYAHTAFVRLTAAEVAKTSPVNNSPSTGFAPILKVDYGVVPYIYYITASDPENGALTFSQATAAQQGDARSTQPAGMTINSATGEVRLNSILAKNYWTTQQIITDNHGNWISIDYLLNVQQRATFCNGLCQGSPNPVCVNDADCNTCNTTCIDAKPRLIVNDANNGGALPNTNLPSPMNQQTFNRNVGQQVVVNYVADDQNLRNPTTGVTITFSATPQGSVVSTQVPCDTPNGCVCNGCNPLPQLRTLTWTPTIAQLGSNTVCVQVKSKGNDLPFPNNPWCITINVIELPITSGAMTSQPLTTEGLTTQPVTSQPLTTQELTTQPLTTELLTTQEMTTQEMTTQEMTTQELTTQPLTTQPLTTQPLTTSFATVAARCSTYNFPETQGYFCAADGSGYYQCLKGPWAPQANFRPCAAGTSCKCPVGVECSAQGICTFGPWNGPY